MSLRRRLALLLLPLTLAVSCLPVAAQAVSAPPSPSSAEVQPPPARLAVVREPSPNLGQWKDRLVAYHDCTRPALTGCYSDDLERQSRRAIAFLDHHPPHPQEKLALVLDIDETSLSNWEEEKADDFGYIARDWDAWVDQRKAPAIAPTLALYRRALQQGLAVFFITGRPERQRAATEDNLRSAGYTRWAGLALRPDRHPADELTEVYKSRERRKIVAAGYRILLNVGDQQSDLEGLPLADLSVKLPNPFYYIP